MTPKDCLGCPSTTYASLSKTIPYKYILKVKIMFPVQVQIQNKPAQSCPFLSNCNHFSIGYYLVILPWPLLKAQTVHGRV